MFDAAFLALAALCSFLVIAKFSLEPRNPDEAVAIVFAPWTSAPDTFSRAVGVGGRFVRFGGYPFIAVIVPDDGAYRSRVLANGAWLIADPKALAACFQPFAKI